MIVTFDCPSCQSPMQGERGKNAPGKAVCPACGKRAPVPNVGLVPGVILGGGYRIDRKLRDRASGTEYLGFQENVDRQVMIKILPGLKTDDEETVQRFLREVQVMSSLQHANIVTAYHAGEDCGTYYLVTRYVEGDRLSERLARQGAFSEKKAISLLLPIARALDYVWREKQILHRNIKPSNIVITPQELPMLLDFALARTANDELGLTGEGVALGTPEYMSPEQVAGEQNLDFRCDLYSLGIVLYETLAGTPPFTDPSPIMVMNKQMDQLPPPLRQRNPAISEPCAQLVEAMLAKDRRDRPQTWTAAIEQMEDLLNKKTGKAKKKKGGAAGKKKIRTTPKATPQAATALKADDVRRIAEQVYPRSPWKTMGFYLASILIPFSGFLLFQLGRRTAPPPRHSVPGQNQQQPVANTVSSAALRDLYARAALAVARGQLQEALAESSAGASSASPAEQQARQFLHRQLQAISNINQRVLKSFSSEMGTRIQLQVKKTKNWYRVEGIKNGKILLTPQQSRTHLRLSPENLAPEEKIARLRRLNEPFTALCCGVVAMRAGQDSKARHLFSTLASPLGKVLADNLNSD